MFRIKTGLKRTRLALLILGLLSLILLASPALLVEVMAAEQPTAGQPISVQPQNQIFNEDLTVEEGQVYENDVNVYVGDVTVESGGAIRGNLFVYSGDVEIEAGGEVSGDIAAFSGDIYLAGRVDGNISAMSGDIELDDSATVGGDLSVVSGEIDQASGASILGNVNRGPSFRLPIPNVFGVPAIPATPGAVEQGWAAVAETERPNMVGGLVRFILRLIGATLLTGLLGLLAWLLYTVRPEIVRKIRITAEEQPALSFAVGAIVNVALFFVTVVLIATICLAPLGLIIGVLLLGLNIADWSATALWVGERVNTYTRTNPQPVVNLVVGVLVTAGSVGLLWALGCWSTCLVIVALLASAPGVGALLLPWLRLGRPTGGDAGTAYSTQTAPTVDPVSAVAPMTTPTTAPTSPVSVYDSMQNVTSDEATSAAPDPETPMILTPATERPSTAPSSSETPSILTPASETVSIETESTETVSILTPSTASESPVQSANFTRIRGVGPVFDARLKDAGVLTFAQLAAMTPEAVATIIGWTPQRVIGDDLLGQARTLANE